MSATTVNPPVIPASPLAIDATTASTEQLAAAIAAAKAQPVVAPPAAATTASQPVVPAPEGYTISSGSDGKLEVKLETGEVFRGTQEEVVAALAKAQFHSHKEITKLRTVPPESPAAPVLPAAPVVDETTAVGREILNLVAPAMGLKTGDEVVEALNAIRATTERSGAQDIATEFMGMCPEFPNSDAAMKILFDRTEKLGLSNVTADALKYIHQSCVADGSYAPLTPDQIRQSHEKALNLTPSISYTPPTPGPILMPSASAAPAAVDPRTMPLAELEALVRKGGR